MTFLRQLRFFRKGYQGATTLGRHHVPKFDLLRGIMRLGNASLGGLAR